MKCQDVTAEGLPCPANARRQPDPDGRRRCPQHSIEPSVRKGIQLSRSRGGLSATGQKPAVISTERYLTSESLDIIYDEALNVLRADLTRRKADKAKTAQAIAAMGDAKLKLRQLEVVARSLGRLKGLALVEAVS